MPCKECRERREKLINAALEGRLLAAAGHAVKGAAEMVGLKPKATVPEYEAAGVIVHSETAGEGEGVQIDAGDPPTPPVKKHRASRS